MKSRFDPMLLSSVKLQQGGLFPSLLSNIFIFTFNIILQRFVFINMVNRLHKTPGAHYESAATRMYVGGRTETIRSCSVESVEFAKAMIDASTSPKEKIAALKRAIQAHKDYTVQASHQLELFNFMSQYICLL